MAPQPTPEWPLGWSCAVDIGLNSPRLSGPFVQTHGVCQRGHAGPLLRSHSSLSDQGVVGRVFGRPLQDVEADWNRVLGQVSSILESAIPGSFNGYDLDTVSIALGFNAKGGLVFIAEAGIQVSVTVTFKRVL